VTILGNDCVKKSYGDFFVDIARFER